MALGDFNINLWKSKESQQQEKEAYEKWAFPHGQKQRDNLQNLLFSIYTKGSVPSTLIPFLTCKELYEDILKRAESRDEAVNLLINRTKSYKQILKKKDIAMYTALVLADADIDERCIYPSVDEIRTRAQELEKLRTKK